MSSNWSCILHEDQIVIHSEESDIAYQYFYPIDTLRKYAQPSKITGLWGPTLSARLTPITTLSGKFIFPANPFPRQTVNVNGNNINIAFTTVQAAINGNAAAAGGAVGGGGGGGGNGNGNAQVGPFAGIGMAGGAGGAPNVNNTNTNPFPFPPWYPESAHFVRQWWPTLPTIPRLSCTVVLLADHDPVTHRTRYVLAQHYFRVPLSRKEFVGEEIGRAHV